MSIIGKTHPTLSKEILIDLENAPVNQSLSQNLLYYKSYFFCDREVKANHIFAHFEPFYNFFQIVMVLDKGLRTIHEEMIEFSSYLSVISGYF